MKEGIVDNEDPIWRIDKPPNEVWVEVTDDTITTMAMAVYGRDGLRPHWRLCDETYASVTTFTKWREIKPS